MTEKINVSLNLPNSEFYEQFVKENAPKIYLCTVSLSKKKIAGEIGDWEIMVVMIAF